MMSAQSWEFTKIVATIGPASDTPELLEALILAGMNVARLNTKHGTTEWHAERIKRIRAASQKVGKPIAILMDLQGPEIRVNLKDKKEFEVKEGQTINLVTEFSDLDRQVQIPQNVIESLQVGHRISFEDGSCEFEISEKLAQRL